MDEGGRRAIKGGDQGTVTVTRGRARGQVSGSMGSDRFGSLADSAGLIPVTRSTTKAQARSISPSLGLEHG